MDDLIGIIDKAFGEGTYKCVISNPARKEEPYRKIEFNFLKDHFQITKYTQTQVFHESKDFLQAREYVLELLSGPYRNLNAWDENYEHSVQISKKGKYSTGKPGRQTARLTRSRPTTGRKTTFSSRERPLSP